MEEVANEEMPSSIARKLSLIPRVRKRDILVMACEYRGAYPEKQALDNRHFLRILTQHRSIKRSLVALLFVRHPEYTDASRS
jgi:hypothetical protein